MKQSSQLPGERICAGSRELGGVADAKSCIPICQSDEIVRSRCFAAIHPNATVRHDMRLRQGDTMKLVGQVTVSQNREIQLLLGDLTDFPGEHAVDVLVVSAFPNDYSPTPHSLIGALSRRGLSVAKLSNAKEFDLRQHFSCWLSSEISPRIPGLEFRRVLCFEPRARGGPPQLVGDIFQALAPFTFAAPNIRSVAMPIVAAGDQGYSVTTMLPPLMDAAVHWMQVGFPIEKIKLVVRDEFALKEALPIFRSYSPATPAKSGGQGTEATLTHPSEKQYDVFVSYSRKDERAASTLAKALQEHSLRVFIDRSEIKPGAAWQQEIFDALELCSATAVLFSPDFLDSKVCKEEFGIAWARHREDERVLIFPLLIRESNLPTYMRLVNYVDCRVSDPARIKAAATDLVDLLGRFDGRDRVGRNRAPHR